MTSDREKTLSEYRQIVDVVRTLAADGRLTSEEVYFILDDPSGTLRQNAGLKLGDFSDIRWRVLRHSLAISRRRLGTLVPDFENDLPDEGQLSR